MINEVNFMNFKGKNKEKESHKKEMDNEIEIVMGDDSNFELEISDVGDCMNNLRPKDREKKKKEIVIPKTKK